LPQVASAGRIGPVRNLTVVVYTNVAHCNGGTMHSSRTQVTEPESNRVGSGDDLVDAVLGSSRALVAVAARSLLTVAEDVTLAQYRVLVELAARGPVRLADLAAVLGVDRSTATRMSDRLARKGLVYRRRLGEDRRTVRVSLTAAGRQLVANVGRSRRAEIRAIVGRMPVPDRAATLTALRAFAAAAGEVPEQDWSLGWNLDA
jgi:DNA-binding MarR family transcriptional regulator